MKDSLKSEDNKKINEEKQIEINKIITMFKLNKESLLTDQYNDCELFNIIREIAISKGGFLNDNNRKLAEGTNTKSKAQIRLDYANRLKADKNGVYRIKIYTEDYQSQKAVRKMTFKVETTTK